MPQKLWVVGEEVLAADFNTYVQNQVVPRFATVAARDSAWPAATAGPGAMCVTYDTGTVWTVIGTAWVPITGSVAQARLSNGYVISTFSALQLLPTEQIIAPPGEYTINTATGEIVATRAGIYQGGFSFYFSGTTATAGWYVQAQLEQRRAGATVASTTVITTQGAIYGTCGGVQMFNMAAGDSIRVWAGISGGNVTVGTASWLHLTRIG